MSNETENQATPEHLQPREFWSLLAYAAALGVFGALVALVFLGVVDIGSGWYGNPTPGWLNGQLWWIAVGAGAGAVVGILRRFMHLPNKSSGLIEDIKSAHVDPETVPAVALISAVSLMGGASLGPEMALGSISGGAGSWLSQRLKFNDEDSRVTTLSGLAGAFGGLFSSPIVTVMLLLEIARPGGMFFSKVIIGSIVASSVSFGIYFAIAGSIFFGIYTMPAYNYMDWHLLAGIALGLLAAALVLILNGIMSLARRAFGLLMNYPILRPIIGGTLFGLIGVMLPLTLFSGSTELQTALAQPAALSVGLLIAVVLGKMVAFSVSEASGFIGGPIFPLLFIGGVSGMIVNQIFTDLPLGLTFACLMAAVPGSLVAAPFTFVLLAGLFTQIGALQTAPVLIAVITAYITISGLKIFIANRKQRLTTNVDKQ